MINKVFIHTKTGNEYLVLEEVEMKCPISEAWYSAVLYEPFTMDADVKYVRAKDSFEKSFKEKAGH